MLKKWLAASEIRWERENNLRFSNTYPSQVSSLDGDVLGFITHLLLRYAESLLQGDLVEFPNARHPTLRHLTFAALVNFSRPSLLSAGQGLTTGATKVPLEAHFQDDIYRAMYYTLDQKMFLTSKWGAQSKGGRVIFLLKQVKWGIECSREGNRRNNHIQRLLPGGRYYPWV